MTDGTALREIAAEILTEILEKGQYTHLALSLIHISSAKIPWGSPDPVGGHQWR